LQAGLAALRLLRRETWDVLVLGHLNLAAMLLTVGRDRLPPGLAFVHGLEAWQPLGRLRRRGLLRVQRILFNSRHTQKRSLAANPWFASLAGEICPLGLLPAEPGGASANGVTEVPTEPFALAIGRMARAEGYKGFEEMIRAWPRVEQRRPGFPLVIIGYGDDQARLKGLAREVGANVRFLGSVNHEVVDACLEACTCFCMPSRGEGLGLVYLQAMRSGKPVLAGSGDAGREVVVDGQTGRTVDPANADELVQGILEVSGDRAWSLGQAGQERFHALFAYERFLERFARHVREVSAVRAVCSA
jgi:glycosyltransferase involved in cell wall biosynthesis